MKPKYALTTPEGIKVTDQEKPEHQYETCFGFSKKYPCDGRPKVHYCTCWDHMQAAESWQQSFVLVEEDQEEAGDSINHITKPIRIRIAKEKGISESSVASYGLDMDELKDTIIGPLELPEGEVVEQHRYHVSGCSPSPWSSLPVHEDVLKNNPNILEHRQVFRFKPQK